MNKGFTLVEILAVLVVVGIISLIVYPAIIGVINTSRNSAHDNQVMIIEKAAKEWAVEHPLELPKLGSSCSSKCVSVSTLTDSGYLATDEVEDPKGGTFNGGVEISCDGNKYKYKYLEEC